jgi:integrase/recombinase XerD
VKTLLLTGARVNEFVHLRAEDLDIEQARIRIRKGKGGKARTVPILPELAHELRTHLGRRRAGWLFETRAAGRYSTRRVQQIVRAVAMKARIVQRVTPHLLRHTVAQHLLDRGMPIDQVRQFLGHDDIKTTQIYAEATLGAVSESYRRALGGGMSASWAGTELVPSARAAGWRGLGRWSGDGGRYTVDAYSLALRAR